MGAEMPLFRWNMTINGVEWTIEYVAPNNPVFRLKNGTYTIGLTDNNTKTVYINNKLSDYMTRKVLTHEITHCVCFSYGIYMPLGTEELLADFLSLYGLEIIENVDKVLCEYVKNISTSC